MFKEKPLYRFKYLILLLCCIAACFVNYSFKTKLGSVLLFLFLTLATLLFMFVFFKNQPFGEKQLLFLIIALGFILRVVYIQQVPYYIHQHDVYGKDGHMDYILRLYSGKGLPDTDFWQYYQPPAWHSLCALFMRLQTLIGVPLEAAKENLQCISLFLSSSLMLISHKFLKMFNLKGIGLIIPMCIIAFHPTFIILAGSINNDILSLFLGFLAIVLALKWYRNPKFSTILLLALALGCAMAVKLSAGLCAVAIAMLFAVKFFKKQSNKKRLFCQYACFGTVCCPIALWWAVRGSVLFNRPLTYVPSLDDLYTPPAISPQNVAFHSFFERMFDISSLLDSVYPARILESQGFDYYEYNIPLGALKSSVFGEYYFGKGSFLEFFGVLLFYSAAILAIIAFIYGIYHAVSSIKSKNNVAEKIYPFVLWIVSLVFYVKFCFDYPHFCTMDFRYIALTVIFGALYIGFMLDKIKNKNTILSKITLYGSIILTLVFAISSSVIYLTSP